MWKTKESVPDSVRVNLSSSGLPVETSTTEPAILKTEGVNGIALSSGSGRIVPLIKTRRVG